MKLKKKTPNWLLTSEREYTLSIHFWGALNSGSQLTTTPTICPLLSMTTSPTRRNTYGGRGLRTVLEAAARRTASGQRRIMYGGQDRDMRRHELKSAYKPPKKPWSLSKIMASRASDSWTVWASSKPTRDLRNTNGCMCTGMGLTPFIYLFLNCIHDFGELLVRPLHPHSAVEVGLPPVSPNSHQPETPLLLLAHRKLSQ